MENEKYRIVKDKTVWGLQYAVNELATEGWEPQGSLLVQDGEYIQAMIKKEEEQQVLTEETAQ